MSQIFLCALPHKEARTRCRPPLGVTQASSWPSLDHQGSGP